MADTTYVDGATLLTADTMNDLNRLHYTIFGDPADGAGAVTSLGNKAGFLPWTTGGTSTAYTLTPTPASTANASGQRFRVKFNAAAGATPTLAVSGLTAKNLKYYDSAGAKQAITSTQVPLNWISDVEYDGTDWVVINPAAAVPAATQADQETATSTTTFVSPGRQQFHPSAAKAWGYATYSAGVPTLAANYNISGIVDNGVGDIEFTIGTDMSSGNFACGGSAEHVTRLLAAQTYNNTNAGYVRVFISTDAGAASDPTGVSMWAFGDQA